MRTQTIEQYVREQVAESPKLRKLMIGDWRVNQEKEQPLILGFAVSGLNEEAGEVSGLECRECYKETPMPREKWVEELGDTLWYLTAAAMAKGITLEELFKYNVKKLEDRYGADRSKEA